VKVQAVRSNKKEKQIPVKCLIALINDEEVVAVAK